MRHSSEFRAKARTQLGYEVMALQVTEVMIHWPDEVLQGRQCSVGCHLETPEADSFHSAVEVGLRDMVCQCVVDLNRVSLARRAQDLDTHLQGNLVHEAS